ncbi:MAG TPA: glutamine-hydrolyzing GMP synthase [Bryobacteraceae bacterium]|jgi:GMP synthase (glutamine-hydrolysing)|nr:glutamine-hydrolyzing GMP synthase [Bryobacteraceae bacterium]
MNTDTAAPQITVLDAGGQYCHLIARKIRDLGVSAEVRPSDTPAQQLSGRKGIIISGGPGSVYESGAPKIDPGILELPGTAVLGICYGLQVMALELGGTVSKGAKGEYGMATLQRSHDHPLFAGLNGQTRVWMSHRDRVDAPPPGFRVLAATSECPIAAIAHSNRPLLGLQFHPEVVHTEHGLEIYANFLFGICGCEKDWNPRGRIPQIEETIRQIAGDRNVFFFVSGGVDSTVAYTLCLRALGPERVYGIYVDTGLMREGETDFVRGLFGALGATAFQVENAQEQFLGALGGVFEPEEKRKRIGEEFVAVQDRILSSGDFLDGRWILGQGTIYPDTIESGGTAKADVIKTHHNRVAGIQKLIESGRIIEPLNQFYKDEVRALGRELNIPEEFLTRHPFPGPGLAIRCLCSGGEAELEEVDDGFVIPVRSVGVQGDSRSYRAALLVNGAAHDANIHARATEAVNRSLECNRVVALCAGEKPENLRVMRAFITGERLERLRRVDAAVRKLSAQSGFDHQVWQFPVILIPVGVEGRPDSVVLRPIHSVDGMTAESVVMPAELLDRICEEALRVRGVAAVFYDLTHKPPGTIEWE